MPITIAATNIILKKAISVGLIPMEIFSNSLISSRKHLQTFIKYSSESSWLDLWEKNRFLIIKHSFTDIFQFEVRTLISISGYISLSMKITYIQQSQCPKLHFENQSILSKRQIVILDRCFYSFIISKLYVNWGIHHWKYRNCNL